MPEIVFPPPGPVTAAPRVPGLISRLTDLAGLDLADPLSLLVDGHRELCARAEWLQATLNFGPTVAGQQAYDVPSNVEKYLRVAVNAVPFHKVDEAQVQWTNDGVLVYLVESGSGAYYSMSDAAGVEKLVLFPTPGVDGQAISVTSVLTPPDITEDVNPVTPIRFDCFIFAWAGWKAYEAQQDNPEMGAYYAQQFEDGVAQLRLLRYSRAGREPFVAKVAGRTA